ncbi:MAG: hypothetical protein IJO29_07345 [Oscillospiraceae bacterium]|nr:hypothetical protein [Oscillospiraceae bacterium]
MKLFKNADPAVISETRYIALWALLLSAIMQSVFLLIGKWDYTVILGNLLGFSAAVGNFYLMGLTVQSAVMKDEKEAADTIKLSQTLRFMLLIVIAVIGCVAPIFNTIALLIPFLFPRIAIGMKMFFINK